MPDIVTIDRLVCNSSPTHFDPFGAGIVNGVRQHHIVPARIEMGVKTISGSKMIYCFDPSVNHKLHFAFIFWGLGLIFSRTPRKSYSRYYSVMCKEVLTLRS